MLAVTANWRLTDGSLAPPRAVVADTWLPTIRRAVIRGGFRRDGRYEPVESVALVFAGDTFDWLLSDAWSGRERPWHGGLKSREVRTRVVAASLRANRPVLFGLRRWLRRGIPVPSADSKRRPSARDVSHVKAQVVMLSGDRDAWATEALVAQGKPVQRLGVWVGDTWSDGHVTIRHGHDRDPVAHLVARPDAPGFGRAPTLAESLAVDLIVPFAVALHAETALWHLVRPRLGAIAAAGLMDMPQTVARLVSLWGFASAPGRRVLLTWRRCVTAWMKRVRHEPPVCAAQHDVVEPVADWLEHRVERHDLPLPPAVARLAMERPETSETGTILGHVPLGKAVNGLADIRGPWLVVARPIMCVEPLGKTASDPAVVTIGMPPTHALVEAA